MDAERGIGWARGAGLILGLALAATAVMGWRIPPGSRTLGTDLVVVAMQTGELEVSNLGPMITANGMHPGSSVSGSVEVHNRSSSVLSISVTAQPSTSDLDGLLWIELTAGGRNLYRGTLGGLRRATRRRFTLPSDATTKLDVRAWLPTSAGDGFEGRIADVNLTFGAQVATA